jgi:subtilisin family serine protease
MKVIIGLADSGIAPELAPRVISAQRFVTQGGVVNSTHAVPDPLGHGTALSRIIARYCPDAYFVLAQVFDDRGKTSVAVLETAINWLSAPADIINLSLGLAVEKPSLALACRQAADWGTVLIASSPARGGPVYPAHNDAVWSVTGNIQCDYGFFSRPGLTATDGGVKPPTIAACCYQHKEDQALGKGGASFAAAHFSGWLGKALSLGLTAPQWQALLPPLSPPTSQSGVLGQPQNLLAALT